MAARPQKALPKSVVTEDHRLERTAEEAGRKLCHLRWHWTLDESNRNRVSLSAYGRSVGRHYTTIQKYAHAYPLLTRSKSMPVGEALMRSQDGHDTGAAKDALADAREVTYSTVDRNYHREAIEVRELARRRAKERGTSVEEEAPRVAREVLREQRKEALETIAKGLRRNIPPDELAEREASMAEYSKKFAKEQREMEAAGTKRIHQWLTGWDWSLTTGDWIAENEETIEQLPAKEVRRLLKESDDAIDFITRLKNAINNRGGQSNVRQFKRRGE